MPLSKNMTERELMRAWEFALNEMQDRAKKPEDSSSAHLAKCWANGIGRALLATGWTICLRKDGKEIVLSQGSLSDS